MKCFSYIEKDKETIDYLRRYIEGIKKEEQLFAIDNEIQIKKLKNYLKTINCPETDNQEITKWINNNSKELRTWINSLKMVAMFTFFYDRINNTINSNIEEELLKIIDLWNEQKQKVCDTIMDK